MQWKNKLNRHIPVDNVDMHLPKSSIIYSLPKYKIMEKDSSSQHLDFNFGFSSF